MRFGNRWFIGTLTILCLTGISGRASAQNHPLFHLYHALWELRDARIELRESRWQFGDHKFKAERAIDDGIRQIELILRNTGDFARGEPRRFDFREEYRRYPHHPHLHHAVVELRLADRELREPATASAVTRMLLCAISKLPPTRSNCS